MIKVINNLVKCWNRIEKLNCSPEFIEHLDSLIREAFDELEGYR